MGCWNETCVLTRAPIHYGASVVALNTVNGPQYKEPSGGGFKTSLLFGLPFKGKYDDYGGIDNLERPELAEFADKAFSNCGMYREHVTKRSFGMTAHRLVAAHPDTLWGLETPMKHLFYGELGVTMREVDSSDEAARAKTSEAFTRSQAALIQLGRALKKAEFAEDNDTFLEQVMALVQDAFGANQAWAAYDFLSRKGLFASRGTLLMHRVAYDELVKRFSANKVYTYGSKQRQSLRSFIENELDTWVPKFEEELERNKKMFEVIPRLDADEETLDRLEGMALRYATKCDFLKPLTQPWMTTELPLTGHYWGGASVREVLDSHDRQELVDYLVFQWARNYLRIDLTPPSSGSQNEEVQLLRQVNMAVYGELRRAGKLKNDFYGCIHR